MNRGFYFKTKNNTYFYSDVDGHVSHCKEEKDTEIIYGEEKESNNIDTHIVKKYVEKNGFKQLILMITQDCNMRCKYCAYSGEYNNQREHTRMKMSFETAKKAIKKYHESYMKTRKIDFAVLPAIGFYGGEPLLEIDLMKKCVEYIHEIFEENVCILVTTNGTIMDEDIAKFLIDNKIHVTFSLNGYKAENDRMRVYADGRGTYDDIYEHLMLIRELDEEYYKNYINLSGVMDFGTDLVELDKFYETNTEIPGFARNSMVLDYFTDWYDRYSKDKKDSYFENKEKLYESCKQKILEKRYEDITKMEKSIWLQEMLTVANRQQGLTLEQLKSELLPYTGTCCPGSKVAVAPDGSIHCCEKVNLERPIGHVDNWLDYEKATDLINDYNKVIAPKCSKCPIQRLCPVCYTACLDDKGEFVLDNIEDCHANIDYYKDLFIRLYTLYEEGAERDVNIFIGGK